MNVDIDISQRGSQRTGLSVTSPLLTISAALFAGAILLLLTNNDPIATYLAIFIDPVTNINDITSILNRLIPLFLAGLAVYVPYKSGLWNIGAEGQLYVGAMAVTWIGLQTGPNTSPVLILALLVAVGALAGALWGAIPGYLRAKWGVNEIIITLMLTFTATRLNEYMIRGPLQASGGFPASENLPANALLPSFFGVNVGIVIVIIAALGVYFVENNTVFGYQLRVIDRNPLAGVAAGVSKFRIYLVVMILGGIFAGIVGMYQISAVQNRLQTAISPGYGFTAIPIALLGRNGVFRLLLASGLFAVMFVGGSTASITVGVPASILDVLEALIILFFITTEFFTRYEVNLALRIGGRRVSL